jgi:hypothetical protein
MYPVPKGIIIFSGPRTSTTGKRSCTYEYLMPHAATLVATLIWQGLVTAQIESDAARAEGNGMHRHARYDRSVQDRPSSDALIMVAGLEGSGTTTTHMMLIDGLPGAIGVKGPGLGWNPNDLTVQARARHAAMRPRDVQYFNDYTFKLWHDEGRHYVRGWYRALLGPPSAHALFKRAAPLIVGAT